MTPMTPQQQLEHHLTGALNLIMPKDRLGLMLANLALLWAFCFIAVVMLPVVVLGSMAVCVFLLPVFMIKAFANRKRPALSTTDVATAVATQRELMRELRLVTKEQAR